MKWSTLPKFIWNKIFDYDSTYHEHYFYLLKEFKEKLSFWRIKWNTDIQGIVFKYLQKQNAVLKLINYFEKDSHRFDQRKISKCTDLFITDEEENCHCKLLQHLKDTKGYIWHKANNYFYKPGTKK